VITALRPDTPGPYGTGLMFGSATNPDSPRPRHPRTLYFEVVPDGVVRVQWVFPRQVVGQFEPSTPAAVYPRPLTVNAPVHDNVAAIEMPTRGPAAVDTWYAADGRVIASHGTSKNLNGIVRGLAPQPPTPLSRRAARDPSTPNAVHATPTIGGRHTVFRITFKVLISNASYRFAVTGGPHPGCAPDYGGNAKYGHDNYSGSSLRGQTFAIAIVPRYGGWCPGIYNVSAAVIGPRGTPFPPFGNAGLAVR
jgi:hypothetical protein